MFVGTIALLLTTPSPSNQLGPLLEMNVPVETSASPPEDAYCPVLEYHSAMRKLTMKLTLLTVLDFYLKRLP